jgi:hypothetical protein
MDGPFHLPWTGHKTTDDKIWDEDLLEKAFSGKEIIITEKMDGENTTVYDDGSFHARSIDGRWHPSRNRMVGIAKGLGAQLPRGYRLCGENLYAQHSITYTNLPCYYMVFGIYDEKNMCLSWDDTEYFAKEIGATLVPRIWRGDWDHFYVNHPDMTRFIMSNDWLSGSEHGMMGAREGYVVRTTEGFHYDDLGSHCGKYVRKDHIQTNEHWMYKAVVPNGLANEN